mmetsp:Transcript_35649/g.76012  ORF Transcript_35649/g.76012 Transcript_35649/m.76012 type:complete len:212 (-) Transcript_35649:1179-1814(-)
MLPGFFINELVSFPGACLGLILPVQLPVQGMHSLHALQSKENPAVVFTGLPILLFRRVGTVRAARSWPLTLSAAVMPGIFESSFDCFVTDDCWNTSKRFLNVLRLHEKGWCLGLLDRFLVYCGRQGGSIELVMIAGAWTTVLLLPGTPLRFGSLRLLLVQPFAAHPSIFSPLGFFLRPSGAREERVRRRQQPEFQLATQLGLFHAGRERHR